MRARSKKRCAHLKRRSDMPEETWIALIAGIAVVIFSSLFTKQK
jgi:hypothetical protein